MTTATAPFVSLFGLDPATYRPHALHDETRTYPETDCYTDIIIELLHARGDEPLAVLGPTVRLDLEGDQWTFFKPDPRALEQFFGVDIHEMQPYRPLPAQIAELIGAGHTMTVELDAWHMPDTASTSYRAEHVKTSIIPESIDPERELLRYFHNASYHELDGADFRGIFRLDGADPAILPPYAEIVRFDAGPRLSGADLRRAALAELRHHLERVPRTNPFGRFGARLGTDLPRLLEGDAAAYHAYAFATVRMAGAGFELCAAHVDWLLGAAGAPAVAAFTRIVEGSKVLNFRLARRRAFDPTPIIDDLGAAWDEAMSSLRRAVG
ncbi:MAG: DUF1839 family protein [Candidatus Limnocylindrales bacterium]